jgi:hypothetical protein
MPAPGECRNCERLRMIPVLRTCRQDKWQPMGRDRRVKKSHRESRDRDGRENCFVHIREKCGKSLSASPLRTKIIGLVGFEPTACRRGDRSTLPYRAHLYLVRSCNIARVAPLRNEWQSIHYGLEATAFHVSSPWNH